MKEVELKGTRYFGGDIVPALIAGNKKFETENIKFQCLDATSDELPQVDLVFIRDCLVHLTFEQAMDALRNVVASDSKWLLTTTFVERESNKDIVAGMWRPLNLQLPPFNLPPPTETIDEDHPDSKWYDKSMGLWKIADLKQIIGG